MSTNTAVERGTRLAEVAARQHGLITRPQLLAIGFSSKQVRHRLQSKVLAAVHRGVYAVGPVPGKRHREMAAVLACGAGAALSHWSAGAVWELGSARAGRSFAVSVTRDVRINDSGIRVFRVSRLDEDEVTTVDGVPLTSPARTLLDLAAWSTAGGAERAFSRAVPRLVDPRELEDLLSRYPRRRGRRRLEELLASYSTHGITRSEAEREFLRLLKSGGLQLPQTNVNVEGYEVDCLWPAHRLVVEIDGRAYHSDPRTFEADRDRDAALVAAGHRVVRITWKQIQSRPRLVLVRLAKALAQD